MHRESKAPFPGMLYGAEKSKEIEKRNNGLGDKG
jgi:hypothetical protein